MLGLSSCSSSTSTDDEGAGLPRSLTVPTEYACIRDAIEAAQDGDSVIILPGVYEGLGNTDLLIQNMGLNLIGPAGRDSTILLCSTPGSPGGGMRFSGSGQTRSMVRGLTFKSARRPSHSGAAIKCGDADLTISSCRFLDGFAHEGGALSTVRSDVNVWSSEFVGNQASYIGGAVWLDASWVRFDSCVFSRNASADGVVSMSSTIADFRKCTFERNTGGALICARSILTGGMCLIANNNGTGGVLAQHGTIVELSSSTIAENIGRGSAGGIHITRGCSLILSESIVADNCSPSGPPDIVVAFGAGAWLGYCCYDSSGCDFGGGVATAGEPFPADPLFRSPVGCGSPIQGDYRLLPESPCRSENNPDHVWIGWPGPFGGQPTDGGP